jgi:hypothetical protein
MKKKKKHKNIIKNFPCDKCGKNFYTNRDGREWLIGGDGLFYCPDCRSAAHAAHKKQIDNF